MNLNVVVMSGNLVADPELKVVKGGHNLCTYSLACNYRKGREPETCFLACEVWGSGAEVFHRYMKKGSAVLLRGRLRHNRWKSDDGTTHERHVMTVDEFIFLSGSPGGNENNQVWATPDPPWIPESN
jgi:single stranded DNA-binding protein